MFHSFYTALKHVPKSWMIVENSMHIFLLYVILPPFSFDSPISKIELFSFDSPIWVDILE